MAFIHVPSQDSFGKRFGDALIPQITKGFERYADEQAATKKAANQFKYDVELEREKSNLKNSPEALAADKKSSDSIAKYFGEHAREVFDASTEGGKTKVIESLLTGLQYGENVNNLLENAIQKNPKDIGVGSATNQNTETPEPEEKLPPGKKFERQESRYKTNLPLYQDEQKKLESLKSESELIDILDNLNSSGKLPENLGRINVNPTSGKIIIPALSSPEAQQFVKTVQEFTSKAKDTFGARVSNFELDTFLQRLPTLANSEAGREIILKQMKYFNGINNAYQENLARYVNEKGGIRNVDFDVAERVARERAKSQVEGLKKLFKQTEKNGANLYKEHAERLKKKVPSGHILVQKDGQFGYMTREQLKEAKKAGQDFEEL